jgi:hypothetical protein
VPLPRVYKTLANFVIRGIRCIYANFPVGHGTNQVSRIIDNPESPRIEAGGLITKVSTSLGLVYGWGIVCKTTVNGILTPYFDLQGDHIPEEEMVKAVTKFMSNVRAMKVMHAGENVGTIVHSMTITEELAKDWNDPPPTMTGWRIAAKPDSAAHFEAFRSGEYRGFSIGGRGVRVPA